MTPTSNVTDEMVTAACVVYWEKSGMTISNAKKDFQAMRSALQAALSSAMPWWRPIDTCPMDGSKFLVYTDRLGVAVVYHNTDDPHEEHVSPRGLRLMIEDGKF